MILTKEERDKFAMWCEQQAADSSALVEQLRKIGPQGEMLAARDKQEAAAAAALLIARKLRAIEDWSIG